MDTKELLMDAYLFRNACKRFDINKKITEEDFQFILEAGRLSPSSYGLEPWNFLIVQNPQLREKLKEIAPGAKNSLDGASHFMIILARRRIDLHYDAEYVYKIRTEIQKLPETTLPNTYAFYKNWQINQFLLDGDDRATFDWACKQTYIAMGNMLTAAAALKIDSCPIEGFDRAAVEKLLADEGVMDITHLGVASMIGFGYRGEEPKHEKRRQALDDIVHWV